MKAAAEADTPGAGLTPIAEALDRLLASGRPLCEVETIGLRAANGRVLAVDVMAGIDVPGWDNSAMDGFAICAADQTQCMALPISQRIPAGHSGTPLKPKTAARIFTGAPLPQGADAVVMQENCRVEGGQVEILQRVESGENVRVRGDDIARGSLLLSAGTRLHPADIGVLASCGQDTVEVRRRLRVALLTTGDELVRPGEPLQAGQLYNSNFFALAALVETLGAELIDCGIVADDPEHTVMTLRAAAERADCVISCGGVSVGEEDHVRHAVMACGRLDLWKLAIKPGKPFAFGEVAGKPFFGLPGNPVSAFVTFLLMVRPCLLQFMGASQLHVPHYSLPAAFAWPRSGVRQEYLRVSRNPQGMLEAFDRQGSGVLTSLSRSDGLAIVPPFTGVTPGDMLAFIPFTECFR